MSQTTRNHNLTELKSFCGMGTIINDHVESSLLLRTIVCLGPIISRAYPVIIPSDWNTRYMFIPSVAIFPEPDEKITIIFQLKSCGRADVVFELSRWSGKNQFYQPKLTIGDDIQGDPAGEH